ARTTVMPPMSGVAAGSALSHTDWIDHNKTWAKSRHPNEVPDVERQQVRHTVDVADGNQPRVMHLLANDSQRADQGFPCRVDVRCLRQQGKSCLEGRGLGLRVHG